MLPASKVILSAPLAVAMFVALNVGVAAFAQDGPAAAPKLLYDTDPAHSEGRIADAHETVTVTPRDGGLDVMIAGSNEGYPGFSIVPVEGESWNLSPWGHVQADITNAGEANQRVHIRVDNAGRWQDNPWNTEVISIPSGQTRSLKVIFGHHHGFKPGFKLDPSAVIRVLFFVERSNSERSFRVENIQAGGPAGETPPVDPASVVTRPEGGVLFATGAPFDAVAQLVAREDARATLHEGRVLRLEADAGKPLSVTVRPAMGVWNLGMYHEVRVTVRNTGASAVTPRLRLESRGGRSDTQAAAEPIAPGAEATLTATFVAATPWVGELHPNRKHSGNKSGTGTPFESSRANGVTILAGAEPEARRLEISSILASNAPVEIPAWVGSRPPVEGDWSMTFEDNFEGDSIDLQRWNIYTRNFWDRRTHFTRDNTIVEDGKLILRYEQKTGHNNDDPDDDSAVARTNFACGYTDTFGKWTQRYGYFEARMKLPTCPGLWPAFWMMPDRGVEDGIWWKRQRTEAGGMEFDIMEHLTAWGPYRFNVAMHFDGYGDNHKAIGSSNIYVPTDEEGFFTIGLLWTPGSAVFYGNGEEIGRWEHERVASVQSYMILYMVSGGWANVPLDPSQLPDDFVIDYVRVWQRADLATPEDGHKPNDGEPFSQF